MIISEVMRDQESRHSGPLRGKKRNKKRRHKGRLAKLTHIFRGKHLKANGGRAPTYEEKWRCRAAAGAFLGVGPPRSPSAPPPPLPPGSPPPRTIPLRKRKRKRAKRTGAGSSVRGLSPTSPAVGAACEALSAAALECLGRTRVSTGTRDEAEETTMSEETGYVGIAGGTWREGVGGGGR